MYTVCFLFKGLQVTHRQVDGGLVSPSRQKYIYFYTVLVLGFWFALFSGFFSFIHNSWITIFPNMHLDDEKGVAIKKLLFSVGITLAEHSKGKQLAFMFLQVAF